MFSQRIPDAPVERLTPELANFVQSHTLTLTRTFDI